MQDESSNGSAEAGDPADEAVEAVAEKPAAPDPLEEAKAEAKN